MNRRRVVAFVRAFSALALGLILGAYVPWWWALAATVLIGVFTAATLYLNGREVFKR